MECFNDLLLKLQQVREREVEGWQVKVQELSNKKGCDTKRMEELFTRNQQMKEQHRVLTENIKTLENRLRAGLCDRCTVTQDVASRRQQEFEASQIQSLQHISRLVGEMNNLKRENKRFRDEIRSLKTALEGHSDHSSSSSTFTEVKPNSSPDFLPSSGPEALITAATSRASNQSSDGDVGKKPERDQRTEEAEHRQMRGMSRSHYDAYKPLALSTLASPPWKAEHSVTRAGERRAQSMEGVDPRSPIAPQALLPKVSSSPTGEVNPSRHVLHTPVPCRPQPIKSSALSLPWPLSESSDWVSLASARTSQLMQPSSEPRFPNLIPNSQHASPRRPAFGSPWPKQSTNPSAVKEPTVVFRFRNLSDHPESQIKPQEKKDIQPIKNESVSGEVLKEMHEGPLDLSDRGKSKSGQTPRDDSPLNLQGGERVQMSPDNALKTNTLAHVPVSSPLPVYQSSSSKPPVKQQEEEPTSDHNHKQVIKDEEQKEEVNGKTDQTNEKKVPVLTISLRPVVVLETLNSALQKQESILSNGKSSTPAAEPGSSSDEEDEEGSQGCKRKRASVETDSDTDNLQYEKNRGGQPRQKKMTSH
ncbi:RBBP8 N-terminal-like protein isoform X1 [Hippoglossus hippoglossus]|uniref:RBBP8 N-terminal-like protein isoform X1 n=1 Tax=Hippoglossus hippoglossus TaxID=8267 RepID=UPI00148C877F|nr:RBBP8 N-terminal-like protein isoform X1 [Hippoglossus hippoglossus]